MRSAFISIAKYSRTDFLPFGRSIPNVLIYLLLVFAGYMYFVPSTQANTSASNSGLLISAPQLGSDAVTITATNSSDKSISFSAKISYTYESFTGDRVSGSKTVSATLTPGQSDASAGTISERRIQVEKVTIFSISSF